LSKIWALKSCERCHGDMIIDSDDDGFYESCVNCGNIRYIHTPQYKSGQKEEPKKDGKDNKK